MKVTVCFGDVRVVVPCGNGRCRVRELVDDAVDRYQKALPKAGDSENWAVMRAALRLLTSDGGILDPDDYVSDVVDDREQLSVIHGEDGEQSNFLGHRQHNDGDGTSGSSHGTSSPDIFREAATGLQATQHQHDEQVPPSPAAETDDDVVVMPQDLLAEPKLTVRRGSDSAVYRAVLDSSSDCSTDSTVISALQKYQLTALANNVESAVLPSNHLTKHPLQQRREPVGGSSAAESVAVVNGPVDDSSVEPTSRSLYQTLNIELEGSKKPLGIHVLPDHYEEKRSIGLRIENLENGGRAQQDGRLHLGDRITEVNGISLTGVDFIRAQEIFRSGLDSPHLHLTVERSIESASANDTPQTSATSVSTASGNCGVAVSKKAVPPVPIRQSSVSDNASSACIVSKTLNVQLFKGDVGLGFTVVTRAGRDVGQCMVYVKNILQQGAAGKDGRLKPGDLILEINGQSMVNKSQDDALVLLRDTKPGGTVRLVVSRQALKQSAPDNAVVRRPVKSAQQQRPVSTLGFSELKLSPVEAGVNKIMAARSTSELVDDEAVDQTDIQSKTYVAKVTFAQSPNMRVEKLSDIDEHLNKDGRPSSDESDNESMAGRQKHASSATAYNTQPGSPSSEVRSTDAITASASKPTADAVQPYHAMMRKSRKSISLDDLQTAGNDSSVADLADDLDPQSQSVMYARNMNQSFRVAVDKSYDGASLAASLAEVNWTDEKKGKGKKELGKGGFARFFRFSRKRNKSVPNKSASKDSSPAKTQPSNRLENKATVLTISRPLELTSTPSSINYEHLHTSPADAAGTKQPQHVTSVSPAVCEPHGIHGGVSPSFTCNQLTTNSPQHRLLSQTSDSRTSPTYRSVAQQPMFSPRDDVGRIQQAVMGSSVNQTVSGTDEPQRCRVHEPVLPPFNNNVERRLPTNLSQRQHFSQYAQQIPDSRTSPAYRSPPQQPMYSPHDGVGRTSQSVRGTSANQIVSGTDEPQQHGVGKPVSPLFTGHVERQLPANSPQNRHLTQYSRNIPDKQIPGSYIRLAYQSPHQQQVNNPRDVAGMSEALRGISPNRVMSVADETGYPRIVAPVKPSVEPQVYVRPSQNQKHTTVSQYLQPAGNSDQYWRCDPISVSRGVDPYRQQLPTATEPRLGLSTSDLDGVHQQRTANRSSSYREQPPSAHSGVMYQDRPTVQSHRSNSQREVFPTDNERGQYGERILSFGNLPSPSVQNILMNDPYRLRYAPVDGANHLQHDRVDAGPVPSRDHDLNMNNRLRTRGTENAIDNTRRIPALHGLGPAVSGLPQYSVRAYRGQQNHHLYRYPSPAYFIEQSVNPRPLPPVEHQHDSSKDSLIEPQYFRNRQLTTAPMTVNKLANQPRARSADARVHVGRQDDVTRPETKWRGAQWDLSQLPNSSREQIPSIPTATSSNSDIPIIKYNAAHQSALGINVYSYGPPRLAPPARYPLLN